MIAMPTAGAQEIDKKSDETDAKQDKANQWNQAAPNVGGRANTSDFQGFEQLIQSEHKQADNHQYHRSPS